MQYNRKQFSTKILIMYMITALLFLTSVDLHIHTADKAAVADHGSAVSISSLTGDIMSDVDNDEITVSPDSVLKEKQNSVNVLATFMMVTIILAVVCRRFIGHLRESHAQLPGVPLHSTPPLRAPPL